LNAPKVEFGPAPDAAGPAPTSLPDQKRAEGNRVSNEVKNRGGILGGAFESFVRSEVIGSLLLLASTALALGWANSPWAEAYTNILHTEIGISWGATAFTLTLQHWINDLLMAVFFFVVGLEIKREVVVGELSSVGKAALPVAAAAGGMIVPAAFYFAFNRGGEGMSGWGVPMATDIAFALGILAVFGKRVPVGLKVFLTALAIADDLGAVAVIAVFYSGAIRWTALLAAVLGLGLIVVAARARIRWSGIYLVLAGAVWLAVLSSGLHATIAGILVALLVPVKVPAEPDAALNIVKSKLAELQGLGLSRESMIVERSQLEAIEELHRATAELRPPGLTLEERLHPLVAFLILPLFALFNAGVSLGEGFARHLTNPVALGIVLGLVLGKQLGVIGASWLAIRFGRATMPDGVSWRQLHGVACLAGIGFTMSLFITDLAFADDNIVASAKVGILLASALAGVLGLLVLHRSLAPGAVARDGDSSSADA
jgi:NhaA family Na+:H+ antiporter